MHALDVYPGVVRNRAIFDPESGWHGGDEGGEVSGVPQAAVPHVHTVHQGDVQLRCVPVHLVQGYDLS